MFNQQSVKQILQMMNLKKGLSKFQTLKRKQLFFLMKILNKKLIKSRKLKMKKIRNQNYKMKIMKVKIMKIKNKKRKMKKISLFKKKKGLSLEFK